MQPFQNDVLRLFTCIVFALHGTGPCFPWSAPTTCDSGASASESGPTDGDSPLPGFLSAGSTTKTHADALRQQSEHTRQT